MTHFEQGIALGRTTSAPEITCIGLRGIQQIRRARSSARIAGRTKAKVQAAKEYVSKKQTKGIDIELFVKSAKDFPIKPATKKAATPIKESTLSLSECGALVATASMGDIEAGLSGLSCNNKAKLCKIFSAPEIMKAQESKTLGAYIAAGSSATPVDVESALSALIGDSKARLQEIFASLPSAKIAGLGEEIPKSITSSAVTLEEMLSLLAFASAADIEAAFGSFSADVMAKLTEAFGCEVKVEAKESSLTDTAALLSFANSVETEDALANLNAGVMAKLTEAIESEAKKGNNANTLTEMVAMLGSASAAETEVALAGCSADVKAKLTEAVGNGERVEKKIDSLTDIIALWESASVAETEATLASFSADVKTKLKKALRPHGDFRSLPHAVWGDIHSLFQVRPQCHTEQTASRLKETTTHWLHSEKMPATEVINAGSSVTASRPALFNAKPSVMTWMMGKPRRKL